MMAKFVKKKKEIAQNETSQEKWNIRMQQCKRKFLNESEFNQWKDILIFEAFNEKVWLHYDHSNYNQETKSVPNYLNQPDYNEKQ